MPQQIQTASPINAKCIVVHILAQEKPFFITQKNTNIQNGGEQFAAFCHGAIA
jgi:hypothetical protein